MRKWILGLVLVNIFTVCLAQQAERDKLLKKRVILPHGWALTPAGHNLSLGELPRDMVVSSSGKYLAVTNNGANAGAIQLIDAEKEKILDAVAIPTPCMGMKFSGDEKFLYVCREGAGSVLQYSVIHNRLVLADSIVPEKKWRDGVSPAGFDIDEKRNLLYLVSGKDHSLFVADLLKKIFVQRFELGAEGYDCLLSANERELYIACKGDDKVYVFDTEASRFAATIAVGKDPNDLCLTSDGRFLFVASNEDHSVSVIDTKLGKPVETLNAALFAGVPSGAAANALALSEDGGTLYIANGDNNCLSVWDVTHPGSDQCKGFIPVGWYPTAVKQIGNRLVVANGKGFSSLAYTGGNPANAGSPIRYHNGTNDQSKEVRYIVSLFTGSLSIVEPPGDKLLGVYSRLVYQNCPYRRAQELQKQTTVESAGTDRLSMK
ncbi:MAG: beta-propeller fold lactonase family protein [Puia sp.]|nr:beta-propeller fold lactonase family protein [Puia sp.]